MRPYGTDGSSWSSHPVIRTATGNQKGLEYARLQSDNQTHETGERLPCCLTVSRACLLPSTHDSRFTARCSPIQLLSRRLEPTE